MNLIINNVFERSLYYKNTEILKYKIEYPQMVNSMYRVGEQVFNRYNLNKALKLKYYAETELFNEAKKLYDFNKENGYPVMVYEVDLVYNITHNMGKIISLYSDQYTFTGGAHGNTVREAQNWDLQLARQIPLQYFFPNNPYYIIDIIKEINKQIAEQMANGSGQYFDDYCQLVLETFNLKNYYIQNGNIVIFFQQYDIAPYSSGIPTFVFLSVQLLF